MLKEKNCQPITLQPVKILFRNKGEIMIFLNEGKLREFVARQGYKNGNLKRMGTGSFLNKKEIIKERTMEHEEGRKGT